jgi:hypothetical protein
MSEKRIVSKEEFERALKRLAELNAEQNTLFIRHLVTEDEQPLLKWVIKNHEEVERLSKIIEAYGKKGKS